MNTQSPFETYSIGVVARFSGLAENTVRRDVKLGRLTLEKPDWLYPLPIKGLANKKTIIPWLLERSMCGGLTIESRMWLEELQK
jgi:hypothetical protein